MSEYRNNIRTIQATINELNTCVDYMQKCNSLITTMLGGQRASEGPPPIYTSQIAEISIHELESVCNRICMQACDMAVNDLSAISAHCLQMLPEVRSQRYMPIVVEAVSGPVSAPELPNDVAVTNVLSAVNTTVNATVTPDAPAVDLAASTTTARGVSEVIANAAEVKTNSLECAAVQVKPVAKYTTYKLTSTLHRPDWVNVKLSRENGNCIIKYVRFVTNYDGVEEHRQVAVALKTVQMCVNTYIYSITSPDNVVYDLVLFRDKLDIYVLNSMGHAIYTFVSI